MNAGALCLAGTYVPSPSLDRRAARPTDEAVCLTMEADELDQLSKGLLDEGVRLYAWAYRQLRRTYPDGTVQTLLIWTQDRWQNWPSHVEALRSALSATHAPYQFVMLGENIEDAKHVYGNGFDDTDMDGVMLQHTWCW